jgi:hypothetical protein
LTFSYWIDIPWFRTEGKLAAIFIKPSLGVPNWPVIYIKRNQVFWHHQYRAIKAIESGRRISFAFSK